RTEKTNKAIPKGVSELIDQKPPNAPVADALIKLQPAKLPKMPPKRNQRPLLGTSHSCNAMSMAAIPDRKMMPPPALVSNWRRNVLPADTTAMKKMLPIIPRRRKQTPRAMRAKRAIREKGDDVFGTEEEEPEFC